MINLDIKLELNAKLSNAESRLTERYNISKSNVLFLSQLVASDLSKGAVSGGTSKIFGRFLSTHPEYFQARFIDLSGKEQIRVQNNGKEFPIIDSNSLTDKSNRYYFKESVGLKNNNVFVSRMDLNVENGQVELPYRPTIRFLTPVSLGHEKMGIAGINLDARN